MNTLPTLLFFCFIRAVGLVASRWRAKAYAYLLMLAVLPFLPLLIECLNWCPHLGQVFVYIFPRHLQRGHFSNPWATTSPSLLLQYATAFRSVDNTWNLVGTPHGLRRIQEVLSYLHSVSIFQVQPISFYHLICRFPKTPLLFFVFNLWQEPFFQSLAGAIRLL